MKLSNFRKIKYLTLVAILALFFISGKALAAPIYTRNAPSTALYQATCNGVDSFNGGVGYCDYFDIVPDIDLHVQSISMTDIECNSINTASRYVRYAVYDNSSHSLVFSIGADEGSISCIDPATWALGGWAGNNATTSVATLFSTSTLYTGTSYRVYLQDVDSTLTNEKYGTIGSSDTLYMWGSSSVHVQPSVYLNYPLATTTPYSDFNFWRVDLDGNGTNINSNGNMQVSYARNPDDLFTAKTFDDTYSIDSRIGTVAPFSTFSGITTYSVRKFTPLKTGLWYAQASWTDLQAFTTTSSQIRSFYIATSTNIFPPSSTEAYGNSGGGSTYDNIFNGTSNCTATTTLSLFNIDDWICGFKKVMTNVNSTVDDGLNNIYDLVLKIFPLSIFKVVNDDLTALAVSTTPYEVTLVGHGTVFPGRTFVILNGSTTAWIETYTGFDYKTFFDKIMYTITGVIILLEAAAMIRKIHNSVSNSGGT